jgi:cell division protein FtsI/penicillin-binding protein 2
MECAGRGSTNILGNLRVAAKTGTSETGQFDKDKNEIVHGWEISYAPLDNPKYAMSIFLENGRSGAISYRISREYYKYLLPND